MEPLLDSSSPAVYYRLPGAKGRVGLISPITCKFCSSCNRVRLTAEGKLKYCLHSNEEFDIKKIVREHDSIKEFIEQLITQKPKEHTIEEGNFVSRNMVQTGG
jgi:cyclic pyranopterin phosphate synthase